MNRSFSLFAVVGIIFVFSVRVFAQSEDTVAATIADDEQFSILSQALETSDLLDTLDDTDAEFTVFAPSDDAFEAFLEEEGIELEDLLADPEALSAVLLYHVVDGVLLSEDIEDDMSLETLNGASISVTVTSSGDIILDEFATVTEADIEVDNGVIHVIDGVLLPPDTESSGDAAVSCTVSTDTERSVTVRVGIGENRTSIAFLPANIDVEVLGQNVDDDGNVWFQLNKDQATPNRSNEQAWILADDVETSGDCENVPEAGDSVLRPITQPQPTAVPSTDNAGGTDTGGDTGGTVDTTGQITVSSGTWTRTVAPSFDASCTGYGNVNLPTNEYFLILGNTFTLSRTNAGFNLGALSFTYIGDNTYQASGTLGGTEYGTWYLRATSANRLEGRYIWSFSSGDLDCSATLYVTYTH